MMTIAVGQKAHLKNLSPRSQEHNGLLVEVVSTRPDGCYSVNVIQELPDDCFMTGFIVVEKQLELVA